MSATLPLPAGFAERVVDWQATHGRHDLPWQRDRRPYPVWLSEVMLQQTQVSTVLGYFDRFVSRFPDVRALAAASLDDVLALWSGLGYYGRARNLHRCAQVVVAEHGGEFPRTSSGLAALPGIGRSTAAAIAAFCFGERVAILDGNVKRVLARVLAFDADLAEAAAERRLWDAASALVPAEGVAAYTQGLMDLGATVCLPRAPMCLLCPVAGVCRAAHRSTQGRYPVKSRRSRRGRRENAWLELRWRGRVWLVQRPATGVWAGLWSLPEYESVDSLAAATRDWPGRGEALPPFVHVLTHFDWHLHPWRWTFPSRTSVGTLAPWLAPWPAGRWFEIETARTLALPAPLRK
ncbi:MAG TPA: A/G-specific adenine glycosylase, partial [Caldimonas sp.]|nr:A/G-specific adenine glycosylase [Caldimonas sp.]